MYNYALLAGVQRKYEALRRQWTLDEKENCEEMRKKTAIKKKYRQRRKRVSIIIAFPSVRYVRFLSGYIELGFSLANKIAVAALSLSTAMSDSQYCSGLY